VRVSPPAPSRRASDLFYGGHLVLALAMLSWRAFESIPGVSAEDGGSFSSSGAGRLLAFATLLVAGLGGLAVAFQTLRRWRDTRALLLAACFVLALSTRKRADLFDLVYVALAIALAVWWFRSERAGAQASA
jgi:hypothetical protein